MTDRKVTLREHERWPGEVFYLELEGQRIGQALRDPETGKWLGRLFEVKATPSESAAEVATKLARAVGAEYTGR